MSNSGLITPKKLPQRSFLHPSSSLMESEVSDDSGLGGSNTSRGTPRLQRQRSNKKRRKEKVVPISRRSNSVSSSLKSSLKSIRTKLDRGRRAGLDKIRTTINGIQGGIRRQRLSTSSFRHLMSNSNIGQENNRFCLHMAVSTVAALFGNVLLGGGVAIGQAARFGVVSAISVLATERVINKSRRNSEEIDNSSSTMRMNEVMDVARWELNEKF